MLKKTRSYLNSLNLIEVDPPYLLQSPSLDLHIEVMSTIVNEKEIGYLHTSPEYAMKRLIAKGLKNIYFLGHVFRKNEVGTLHNPEFTMIEWYKTGISFHPFLEEVIDLITLFTGPKKSLFFSYKELFLNYIDIDIDSSSIEDLLALLEEKVDLSYQKTWDKDTLLQLILSTFIEPNMQKNTFVVIYDFPATQAALAKIENHVAKRFEIYFNSVEIANGYHELSDSEEQRKRFIKTNKQRKSKNLSSYSIDEKFLASLNHIGDCYGVSLGFDRLLMLKHKVNDIHFVLPFSWQET